MLGLANEILQNKDGEFIVRLVEALLSGFEVQDLGTFQDDHIDCCEFSFEGHQIQLTWCGFEIIGSVIFNDSLRAQQLLTDYLIAEILCGSIYEAAADLLECGPLGFDDFFSSEHRFRLFDLLLRFESKDELLTSSDEWKRVFAKECLELK